MTNTYSRHNITQKFFPINDPLTIKLKDDWIAGGWPKYTPTDFLPLGVEWFRSTKLNNLLGWNSFPCTDVIMGCTHYLESLIMRFGWDGFQILPSEYAYFGLMGKHGTEVGCLQANKPLILSLPNYKYADLRPQWHDILSECESKNIDIHIDLAWIITARDIELDFDHPNIKSFAMSMSKYNLHWNRVGVRWCRQRTMDSVTIFNHYYEDVNTFLTSCAAFMTQNLPRDHMWDSYAQHHYDACKVLDLIPTKIIHVAHDQQLQPVGISKVIEAVL